MDKKEFIQLYINKCDEVIEFKDVEKSNRLQDEIIATFEGEIPNIKNMLDNYRGCFLDNKAVDFLGDIYLLKQKLTNYYINVDNENKIMLQEIELAKYKQLNISNHAESNQNQAVLNNINFSVSFDDARKNIENMTALKELEINEILDKINEIEKIIKIDDRKTKKWELAKPIIKWVGDKSVDVGITLLPLLLQIGL